MKAILRFDLNDEDDRLQFHYALEGKNAILALEDIRAYLRGKIKYGFEEESPLEAYEAMQKVFFEILDENSIDLSEF